MVDPRTTVLAPLEEEHGADVVDGTVLFERGCLARHPAPVTETGVEARVVETCRNLRQEGD